MRKVLETIDDWTHRIDSHPLHSWLSTPHEDIEDERKLWFSLYFLNFIMYFRELNRYHISYGQARHGDPLREALSRHADEDMTHSRFFMKDFRALGMDRTLGWKPSQVLFWLATSSINLPLRRRTSELTKLVVSSEDPKILYPVVESIEACGHALFRHTAVLAERITARTGHPLIYWGHHHLERETGHAVETGADELFHDLELTPAQRDVARRKVSRVFELIEAQNSDMHRLAQETLSQGSFATRTQLHTRPQSPVPVARGPAATADLDRYHDFNFWPEQPDESQRPVADTLHRQVALLRDCAESEIFTARGIDDVVAKLRLMTLYLCFDVSGSTTAYHYLMALANPQTAAERAVNRLTQRFGRRAQMLYVDWHSLLLDETLGWSTSRMLDFIYLDSETEVFRDLRNTIVHHCDSKPSALHSYWVMVTVKSMTNAYIRPMSHLAQVAEAELGIELPYLMQRRNPVALALEPDPEADAIRLESLPVDDAMRTELCGAVEDIGTAVLRTFRAMEDSFERRAVPEIHQPLAYREAV